ncbi:hypothetical protein FRC02_001668 [Tulasnella sp. 418]|nr:hypothetical protein FRC02_001668 [Tulasnella sp. 418]
MDSSNPSRPKGRGSTSAFNTFKKCGRMVLTALVFGRVRDNRNKAKSPHAVLVTVELLERILEFAVEDEANSISGSRTQVLSNISKVNWFWHSVAQRLLYRLITITSARQLKLLLRTISSESTLTTLISSIAVPRAPHVDPPSYPMWGMNISEDQRASDLQAKHLDCMQNLISLLKLPRNLNTLLLHSEAFDLFPESESLNAAKTTFSLSGLNSLSSVKGLTLLGDQNHHRWLWLIPFMTEVEDFFGVPCWLEKDEAVLIPPVTTWSTRTLTLKPGSSGVDHGMTLGIFKGMIAPPPPRNHTDSLSHSFLRSLDLQDTPVLGSKELPELLTGMTNLQYLRLYSHDRIVHKNLVFSLAVALPFLFSLRTLETNAIAAKPSPEETIPSFPSSLHSVTVSLSAVAWLQQEQADGPSHRGPKVGYIRKTIRRVLKIAKGSQLRNLSIKDCTLSDFLHFNIAGSAEYGDEQESAAQNKMWLMASQMNVLVDVVRPSYVVE